MDVTEVGSAVLGGGLLSLLIGVFGLSLRVILQSGERIDARSEAEIQRAVQALQLEKEECQDLLKAKDKEIEYWRNLWITAVTSTTSERKQSE